MDPVGEKEKYPPKEEVTYEGGSQEHDFEAGAPASGGLARQLKGRHMQMIAIGTLLLEPRPAKPTPTVHSSNFVIQSIDSRTAKVALL